MPNPRSAAELSLAPLAAAPAAHSHLMQAAREDHASGTSQALRTLRAVSLLLVLGMHSTLPYLAFLKPPSIDSSHPPYAWLAIPIVDSQRWLGFDIFSAWVDVYLMSLMFFLSGLFTWPSLKGKGGRGYFVARLTRLGAPFVLGLFVLMPIALYPAYLATGQTPSLTAYARTYLALPFWPNGPMWFLWMLLALTALPAALHRFLPGLAALPGRLSSGAARAPGRYFIGLAVAATLAYVPLAWAFTPWAWSNHGPFSFQLSRPLLYAVYYLAGCGVGAEGLADGLLAGGGQLAKTWRLWLLAAPASFFVWMGLTGLTLSYADAAPLGLQMLSEISYAVAGASSVFFALATAVRWRAVRSRLLDALSHNAFVMYILHYTPLVWLQYALLDVQAPAFVKALLVLAGTAATAYAGASAFGWLSRGARWPTGAPARG